MADAPKPNAEEIAYWTEVGAPAWIRLQAALEREVAPLGERAMDALAPQPGERLIDVGCGCGHATLELARAVGPQGSVLGADISAPMLAVARDHAAAANLPNVRFIEADAQTFDFGGEQFDGIFSRFGVMFFEDAIAAFANLGRALKPRGRLAFVCWRTRDEVEWVTVPLQAAFRTIGTQPPTPSSTFSFAEPDHTRSVLSHAGFSDIAISPLDMRTGGGDLDEVMEIFRMGGVGSLVRKHPDKAEAAFAEIRKTLKDYETPDGVFLGAACWIVTARRP
ncbi:class I SAM-dependent methyltransferase [Mesorhizobium sp. ZC-5]|uniref:class I SAM-dependent methyltransferase n=1 Tax=Mesorhizobium sp. ZC-5 TaxID=2986066 RepID=UPI0021E953A1|nr:class I SAM-dependent methyltransferase [Mesorhizobium sp. ZC-5]MCV3241819.1 class I SAM-dependent methyltransferase [Mesorhizobium sp. ZC-5]